VTLSGSLAKAITAGTTFVTKVLSMEGTATVSQPLHPLLPRLALQYNTSNSHDRTNKVTPFAAAGGLLLMVLTYNNQWRQGLQVRYTINH
jgi:hypothetical protein